VVVPSVFVNVKVTSGSSVSRIIVQVVTFAVSFPAVSLNFTLTVFYPSPEDSCNVFS
jgi:hypothetical protein